MAGDASEDEPGGTETGDEDKDKNKDVPKDELDRIENEKKSWSPEQKLERSYVWKMEGNDSFKGNDMFKAVDAYYHAILYCRDLTQNPKYYPNIGHNETHREAARAICESCFSNLALAQYRHAVALGANDGERRKVLEEAVKSASEALKLNAKNLKALYRRGIGKVALSKGANVKNAEGQNFCSEAKADFLAVVEADPKNKDARTELKAVQDQLKQLKRDAIMREKKEFSFASTLGGVGTKDKDLLGDGSVMKALVATGDGGSWFNDDWMKFENPTKCVVTVRCRMLTADRSKSEDSASKPVTISFTLGDEDMHDGLSSAVQSMTQGEVSNFTFTSRRMAVKSSLTNFLPAPLGETSVWEVAFLKYLTWDDLGRDGGESLQKIQSEGYGDFPEQLAEVHMHWRVTGPDGALIHSSRYTVSLGGEGGMKQVEDEDKPPAVYVLGETAWEPLAVLCRSLRQGGVGELRMRQLPELPQEGPGEGDVGASAKLSMMLNKHKGPEALRHCTVRAELERVIQAVRGPEDLRWEGTPSIVRERWQAEQLLNAGKEIAASARYRRVITWAEQVPNDDVIRKEVASARAASGWVLVCRAAPILDLGNVTSKVMEAATNDAREAETHCVWLERQFPDFVGTLLLRAKLLVAQDDAFAEAHEKLLQAQRQAPNDARVQEELRAVRVELAKEEEQKRHARVSEIRDGLKRARTDGERNQVVALLRELSDTKCSWDTVMDTCIGKELKCCQEDCGDEAKQLCLQILGRFKDESKEQRPLWAS
eukprot:TRINITY_DN43248_c0_g1_i1.p1 TRINITY_DN43248_c0_g1~~TRINITY_DN43248_c0_g1_i1.p1  ORF type:complete len:821 (+),score=178.32 TRINITY_DN43248_c0_g1_i1:159-2465(+)